MSDLSAVTASCNVMAPALYGQQSIPNDVQTSSLIQPANLSYEHVQVACIFEGVIFDTEQGSAGTHLDVALQPHAKVLEHRCASLRMRPFPWSEHTDLLHKCALPCSLQDYVGASARQPSRLQ